MSRLAPPLHLRNETELERCDRHLAELMQEVRVAQTGVQVLFGFLLTVPFTVRFDALTPGQERLFFLTLALAGVAAMLLITPSAQHRILFAAGVAAAACAWCWYGQPLLRRRALHARAESEAPEPLRPHAVQGLYGDASRRWCAPAFGLAVVAAWTGTTLFSACPLVLSAPRSPPNAQRRVLDDHLLVT